MNLESVVSLNKQYYINVQKERWNDWRKIFKFWK